MAVLFGPAGGGEEFINSGGKSTLDLPKWVKEYGLDTFEYSFGHGYQMTSEKAKQIGERASQEGMKISLHAPFYINFANPSEEMYQKSQGYIYTGIKFLRAFGVADKLVFHPASCGKMTREEAVELTYRRFDETFNKLDDEGLLEGIYLCPETMGKTMQIGTWEEVINLCKVNKHLTPTFDFGHINALTNGQLKDVGDYKRIFDYAIEQLGFERINDCHIHFSKIMYGNKGEIKHLNYDDEIYGPNFEPLAKTLIDYNLSPRVICESMSLMPHDALIMKKIYQKTLDI